MGGWAYDESSVKSYRVVRGARYLVNGLRQKYSGGAEVVEKKDLSQEFLKRVDGKSEEEVKHVLEGMRKEFT